MSYIKIIEPFIYMRNFEHTTIAFGGTRGGLHVLYIKQPEYDLLYIWKTSSNHNILANLEVKTFVVSKSAKLRDYGVNLCHTLKL